MRTRQRPGWRRWLLGSLAGALVGLASPALAQKAGCEAIIFWDIDFGGPSMRLLGDVAFVGPQWNDQVSSIQVVSGTWDFYWDANFRGAVMRFGPGSYRFVGREWNDQISSMACR